MIVTAGEGPSKFSINPSCKAMDDVSEELEERRRKVNGTDVDDNSYVIVLNSVPGSKFSQCFEMKNEEDMYRTICDIMGKINGPKSKSIARKYNVPERTYYPNSKETSTIILHDYQPYPRVNYGTGRQYKFSLEHEVFGRMNNSFAKKTILVA